ncbi:MAG: LptA/OstA family protein [Rickettsiales bacterium]
MIIRLFLLVAFGLCSVWVHSADAQSFPAVSSDAPVEIEADTLEVRKNDGVAVFKGNVKARQGAVTMTGKSMRVYYDAESQGVDKGPSGISRIEMDGEVVVDAGADTAKGDIAVYDVKAQTVILRGKEIEIHSGENVLKGKKLTYHLDTGVSVMEGSAGAAKGRVHGVFVPGSEKKK